MPLSPPVPFGARCPGPSSQWWVLHQPHWTRCSPSAGDACCRDVAVAGEMDPQERSSGTCFQFMCPGNGKENYVNIREIMKDIFGIKDALICCLQDGHTLCFSTIRIKGRRFIIKKSNGMGCFMNHRNWSNIADHTVILLSLAHVLNHSIHTIFKHLPRVSWLQLHFFSTRRHLFT